jgi:hypothetical protein
VWGKDLYVDSTQVNANADLDSLTPRCAVEARAAIQEHLTALFPSEAAPLENPEAGRGEVPLSESLGEDSSSAQPAPLPVILSEAEHEELRANHAARHDWIAENGRPQREIHGLYRRTADFKVRTTDPDATPMRLKGGGIHLGYHVHYVVDGGKRRIILAVLVTPGEVMDHQPMLDLLWHVFLRWRLRPKQITGDTTYGTIENIRPSKTLIYGPMFLSQIGTTSRLIMDSLNSPLMPNMIAIFVLRDSHCCLLGSSTRLEMRGVHGQGSSVQCLPVQSPMYFQSAWSASPSLFLRRLPRTSERLSSDVCLPESHEHTKGLG